MTAEEEVERALEYRRKMQARADDRLARERALAGSQKAYNILYENTSALRDWQGWEEEQRVYGDAK